MASSDDNDLSAIAWPGFVDILSAVIIMFVFFLMIVATALYFHILIYKSQDPASPQTAQAQVQTEETVQISQVQTEFAKSKEQKLNVDLENNTITIFFGNDSISLLPETIEEIKTKTASYFQDAGNNYTVRIEGAKNPKTYEALARKLALARLLNVRNTVLQAGASKESIDPAIIEGEPIDGSIQWVRIIFEDKSQ